MSPLVPLLLQSPGCVVVHKPPGVPFHATADHPGLMPLIRSQQGQEHFAYTGPLYPVHRLDYICSGALVLATSPEAAGELVSRFRQRQVTKYYVALSARKPAKKMGSVVGGLQKGRRGSWLLTRDMKDAGITRFVSAAVAPAPPAPALAHATAAAGDAAAEQQEAEEAQQEEEQAANAKVEEEELAERQVASEQQQGEEEGEVGQQREQQRKAALRRLLWARSQPPPQHETLRAFLLKPETGKTHQLRVAMKSLGAPVLGDERYALKEVAAREDRGYLHCAALRFTLQGRPVQVVCPPQHGSHFLGEGFQRQFEAWLPAGLESDHGTWFSDNKLLRSTLLAPAAGGLSVAAEADLAAAAAAEWQW